MTDLNHATKQELATDGTTSPSSLECATEVLAFPLTPGQEAMWNADRSWPGCSLFNASFRWNLAGSLDTEILKRSFNEVVRRHEILRATFAENEGGPVQLIAPSLDLTIALRDLRSLPESQRDAEMDRICAEEAKKAFDLVTGPLMRVGLLQMENERHVLTLTLHHIVIDGWSLSLIMEELQAIYSAYAKGQESPLPELAIQFGDYVVWHKEWMASAEIRQQLDNWKKKLSGYRRLDVPSDFPRTAEREISSKIISQMLPHELTDALKTLSDQMSGTMFTTALAACMMLLRRYTGESDISVASPLAGRNRAEIEGLIGLFFNNLTLRTNVAGDPTFQEFASCVRDTVWEAFANQDIPFEDVVEEIRPESDPLRDPFLSINFVCQREYGRASTFVHKLDNVTVSTMPSKSMGALYDLNFFMVQREAGWRLSLDFNTGLYQEATAQQMLAHFRELLEGIAANPNRRLSEYVLSESSALPRRPVESSNTAREAASQTASSERSSQGGVSEVYAMPVSPAQERFWLLAKLAPANPTFNMASCMRLSGPVATDILERSLQLLVDRHETLRTAFDEVNGELSQIVASSQKLTLEISTLSDLPEVEREIQLRELIREESGAPFDLVGGPLFRARLVRISSENHVLVTTIHHILADGWSGGVIQRELWSAYEALIQGEQPSLAPLAIQYGDFVAWQKEWLTSAEMQEHLDFWTKQLASPLPVVNFPLDRAPTNRPASHGALETRLLAEELQRSLKSLAQSENVTMFTLTLACFATFLSQYSDQTDIVIGSPIANRKPETEPLIGPFAGPVALRMNLSGNPTVRELLHRVGDGVLDALSHSDLPFEKLIEILPASSGARNPIFQFYFSYQTAFLQSRQLQQLTVTPMPKFSLGIPFEMQLAFIERREGVRAELEYNPDLFDAATIHEALGHYEFLLRTMVMHPDRPIADLPRPQVTPSARVEKKVPSNDETLTTIAAETVAPANEREQQLTAMWKEVLRRDSVSVTHNFFELGGYSLSAAKLLLNIEKRFGRKLPLAALFEAPTIRQLASLLQRGDSNTFGGRILPIQTTGSKPPLFCVDGGPFFVPLAQSLGANQPVYGLRLEDTTQFPSPYRFEDIAAYHIESLRMAQPHGPYYLGGWCLAGVLAYEMARQLQAQGEEVVLVALFDAANPAYLRRFSKAEVAVRRSLFWVHKAKLHFHRLRQLGIAAAWEYLGERVESVRQNFRLARLRRDYQSRLGKTEKLSGELRGANAVVYLAAGAYKPGLYSGRVALFRSALEPLSLHRDPMLGWSDVATRMVLEEVPGDHREIFDEPAVRVLAAQLSEQLGYEPALSIQPLPVSRTEFHDTSRIAANSVSQTIPQGTL
jgi:non-ribosomal peptide synthetase component F/thioesterase domain-containing protein